MKKLKRIYEEINNISPIRFAVRIEAKHHIDLTVISKNLQIILPKINLNFNDVLIKRTNDLETSALKSIIKSDYKIIIFYNGQNLITVFDHSVADAKTAINFCTKILSTQTQIYQEDNIQSLNKVFPNKFNGITGGWRTIKAVFEQLFTSVINGKTKFSKDFNRKGLSEDLNILTIKLDKNTTQNLLLKAKDLSTSISSLLISAQVKASYNILHKRDSKAIGVCTAVDLRQRCVVNPNYSNLSLCVSFVTVVAKVTKEDTPRMILDNVTNHLNNKIRSGAHFTLYKMLPPKYFVSKRVVKFFLNLNEKASLQTNVGRISDFCSQSLENILHIDFFVPPGINQPFSICASSFKDELSLSILSFDQQLSSTISHQILEHIKKYLVEELNEKKDNQNH